MTDAPYKVYYINSFDEYIKRIQDCDSQETMLFRGQPLDKPLIPKIGRLKFRNRKSVADNERKLFEEFKRLSIPYIRTTYPGNNWEWLALAQHHGLPTRLLDWSTNPLAALWFAVRSEPNGKEKGVVWVFITSENDIIEDVETTDPFCLKKTRLFKPNIVAERINAQTGWFSAHKFDTNKSKFTPFERNAVYKNRLIKFVIGAEHFSDFRYDLDRFGVNRSTMFPDLDGLASHIQWLYSLIEDEDQGYKCYRRD